VKVIVDLENSYGKDESPTAKSLGKNSGSTLKRKREMDTGTGQSILLFSKR